MYARFVCGGNVFCNPCNQCNPIVFVMGFPFKLRYWRTHRCELFFSSFFPSAQVVIPQELNSCKRTQSKQSLCKHTWEFVEMTPYPLYIMHSHKSTPPRCPLCRRRPLPPPPPSIDRAAVHIAAATVVCRLPPPPSAVVCRQLPPLPSNAAPSRRRRCCPHLTSTAAPAIILLDE